MVKKLYPKRLEYSYKVLWDGGLDALDLECDLVGDCVYGLGAVNCLVEAVVGVEFLQGLSLIVIYLKTMFDSVEIVVGTTSFLAAVDEALYEHFVSYFKADNSVDLTVAFAQDALELFSLADSAGEPVEDDAFACYGFAVEEVGEDVKHELIGDKLAFRYICVGYFAELGATCDMVAEHFAGRDVIETKFVDQTFALGPFAAAGSTEYHDILHKTEWINVIRIR